MEWLVVLVDGVLGLVVLELGDEVLHHEFELVGVGL